ncbi:fatty acyl-CoA reductase 8-like isoform X2 [Papaver somniferum]|uniref:fatty acyl-CoA reductase 8-like isoform X2 n=1 Tax=Papaver somniferum TaxID=3469 RepID=UPI000E6FAD33|nr:fatty acyl-CoA reductase 8-like isoform X2 [Papaver somniferum]
MRHLHDEVTSKEVFKVIKETYEEKFNSFMSEKLIPVAGDTALENLGIGDAKMREKIFRDVDVVVNFAATTNFNERARMFGWPNVYVFTKAMGEMLIGERRENLPIIIVRPTIVTSTIKEPFPGWVEGVKTVDSYFAGFGLGKITFFLGSSKTIMDVIPGDMVVNATMAAMVAHGDKPNSRFMIIYQVGSSNREPMYCSMIKDYAYNHFAKNPLMSKNGKLIKVVKPYCFTSMNSLQIYMDLKYNFPLKGLRLAYAILRHDDGGFCTDMEHQVKFVTKLAIN